MVSIIAHLVQHLVHGAVQVPDDGSVVLCAVQLVSSDFEEEVCVQSTARSVGAEESESCVFIFH